MPFLQHGSLRAVAGTAIDRHRGVLARARAELGPCLLGADVVTRGEHRALAGEDDDAYRVVGFGAGKRLIEFDQHAAVLGVALLGAVQ